MPPFRLEPLKYNPHDRFKKTLHFKRTYGPGVKVENWQSYQFSQPIDNDPYNLNCPDFHLSHYNRLGVCEDVDWKTTTQIALEQIYSRRKDLEVNPFKTMVNLHSAIYGCDEEHSEDLNAPSITAVKNDYISTMQYSYTPPYPFKLQRLSMPKTPHLLNRKLENAGGTCKFLDDDYLFKTKRLQELKKSRWVSYDPCTGSYSDGTPATAPSEQRKCVTLSYN